LIVKWILGFVIGATVGAAAALFFAPSSGQELRARLSQEMAAKRQQIEAASETVEQGPDS
jgi:gas vesicle protein